MLLFPVEWKTLWLPSFHIETIVRYQKKKKRNYCNHIHHEMKIDVKWGFPKQIEVLRVTSNTNEDPFRG